MTEGERRIAALLAQAQMDRDVTQPSNASPLAVELTRPVHQFYMNPAEYADEPQSAVGKAVDDYRSRKRDDVPAMLASGAHNVATMPLRMMTLEGMAGLAKDAWRAIKTPYDVLTSPEPVTTEQMIEPAANIALTAPMAAAGAHAAGVKAAPTERVAFSNSKEAAAPGLVAYHGSPHDFDKFSMDRIGTGEGAQAYGHGLYFAESEGVARSYKKNVSRQHSAPAFTPLQLQDINQAAAWLANGRKGEIPPRVRQHVDDAMSDLGPAASDAELSAHLTGSNEAGVKPGHMYEVRINAEPEHFLDWDKPLSEQSEKVKNAMGGVATARSEKLARDLENVYADLADATGQREAELIKRADALEGELAQTDPKGLAQWRIDSMTKGPEASQRLRDAGIPGIRYLDQGSRGAGEGSRNYVVFDDKIIDVIRKYGFAAAVPMIAEMMARQDPDQQN